MREWSRLPLVAPPSPELPLAQSSALELEKLSQIYHSPQRRKKKVRRLKAEALSSPRVGESERQTATVTGGGEEDFRRGKSVGLEKKKTLRKATQRAAEEKTTSTTAAFCATHNVESESWSDR